MPTSRVEFSPGPPPDADITHCPGVLSMCHSPPDDIAFVVSMPNGKYARMTVDAHELEAVLDTVHEKLVEAMADQHEPEEPPPPPAEDGAAPDVVLPTNTEPAEEQPAE